MGNSTRWIALIAALLLAAAVGGVAYNAGVAHGVVESGKIAAPPGGGPYPYPYPYWGWHRPFGFGFVFVPLFFLAFWMLLARGLFWRRGWHRGACGPGFDPASRLDEWHRRAHERTASGPPGGPSTGGQQER
jgi:hypothetical protein